MLHFPSGTWQLASICNSRTLTMFKEICFILVASSLVVTAALASPEVLDASLKLEWESWKRTHSKAYTNEWQETERSAVWLKNKNLIDTHNAMANEETSYSLAMNEFGDMVITYVGVRTRGEAAEGTSPSPTPP